MKIFKIIQVVTVLFILLEVCICSNISETTYEEILVKEKPDMDNKIQFNSSVVIVWEKCGLAARTQLTQIFKAYNSDSLDLLSYDPSINVIIYELTNIEDASNSSQKQILKLPNIAGELLFFVFKEPGKV